MKKSVVILAVAAMSAFTWGCHSKSTPPSSTLNRPNFNGGPMPANVGQIIAQRMQESEARSAHKAPTAP